MRSHNTKLNMHCSNPKFECTVLIHGVLVFIYLFGRRSGNFELGFAWVWAVRSGGCFPLLEMSRIIWVFANLVSKMINAGAPQQGVFAPLSTSLITRDPNRRIGHWFWLLFTAQASHTAEGHRKITWCTRRLNPKPNATPKESRKFKNIPKTNIHLA